MIEIGSYDKINTENMMRTNRTIFDDVYRTMIQRFPELITMALRMVQYDFTIAVEDAVYQDKPYRLQFPRSCVIYIRGNHDHAGDLQMPVSVATGETVSYKVSALDVQRMTMDDIFDKELIILLPFYVLRYEEKWKTIQQNEDQYHSFMQEMTEICDRLAMNVEIGKRSGMYQDILKLIQRVCHHTCRNKTKLLKGVDEIMGGRILELPSDAIRNEGRIEGRIEGEEKLGRLIQALFNEGKYAEINEVAQDAGIRQTYYQAYGIA